MSKRFIYLRKSRSWEIGRRSRQPEGRSVTSCDTTKWNTMWWRLRLMAYPHPTLKSMVRDLNALGFDRGKRVKAAFPMYEIVPPQSFEQAFCGIEREIPKRNEKPGKV